MVVEILREREILGVIRPTVKHLEFLLRRTTQQKNHSILNNGMIADYNAAVSHYFVPGEKSVGPTPCEAIFHTKFFDHLFVIYPGCTWKAGR